VLSCIVFLVHRHYKYFRIKQQRRTTTFQISSPVQRDEVNVSGIMKLNIFPASVGILLIPLHVNCAESGSMMLQEQTERPSDPKGFLMSRVWI
jgi:hypothetical protein